MDDLKLVVDELVVPVTRKGIKGIIAYRGVILIPLILFRPPRSGLERWRDAPDEFTDSDQRWVSKSPARGGSDGRFFSYLTADQLVHMQRNAAVTALRSIHCARSHDDLLAQIKALIVLLEA